jgi:hypothetical protein
MSWQSVTFPCQSIHGDCCVKGGVMPRARSERASRRSRNPISDAPTQWLAEMLQRVIARAFASGVLLLAASGMAHAQVQVEGRPEAVHLEATDVTLREVLDALHSNFQLAYHGSDDLDSRITGTFDGPLARVAARILVDHDFAMTITPQRIDVMILRQNQAEVRAVAASAQEIPAKSRAPALTAAEANRRERGLTQ